MADYWVNRNAQANGDHEGALREYRELLKLVPDDAEALAAVRGG